MKSGNFGYTLHQLATLLEKLGRIQSAQRRLLHGLTLQRALIVVAGLSSLIIQRSKLTGMSSPSALPMVFGQRHYPGLGKGYGLALKQSHHFEPITSSYNLSWPAPFISETRLGPSKHLMSNRGWDSVPLTSSSNADSLAACGLPKSGLACLVSKLALKWLQLLNWG